LEEEKITMDDCYSVSYPDWCLTHKRPMDICNEKKEISYSNFRECDVVHDISRHECAFCKIESLRNKIYAVLAISPEELSKSSGMTYSQALSAVLRIKKTIELEG